ncbi:hypothetical protein AVEN_63627-1 [Araneus ventricosus]|uniref:Uncharacterized protein n=1 Tax=Araneus ventricosus TaxID=182803 RepID=A0A4Y2JJ62_ARAVE|nr:hypothetical protein AVEN_63627-1 [Araneus ventricosus]
MGMRSCLISKQSLAFRWDTILVWGRVTPIDERSCLCLRGHRTCSPYWGVIMRGPQYPINCRGGRVFPVCLCWAGVDLWGLSCDYGSTCIDPNIWLVGVLGTKARSGYAAPIEW